MSEFSTSGAAHSFDARENATKVPEVTLGFWIIKVLATMLGETGEVPMKQG